MSDVMEMDRPATTEVGGIAADRLKSYVERLERLNEEKKGISDDIKDLLAEAKGTGFNPAIIKHCIKVRAMTKEARQEQDELTYLYLKALGEVV